MCTTTLPSIARTEPASRLHAEVITEYLVFLRDHPSLTKRIERAWQLLLRRFVKAQVKRRLFQVISFLSNVIAILLELERKLLTTTQWINDCKHTWTFALSKTFDLVPIVTDIEVQSMRCGELLQRIGMEKVWLLQHQISRCCVDIFTVTAEDVFLRALLCCSWRLAEACGPNKDAVKISCRTTLFARDVMQLKSNQKSTDLTFAKETPQVTLTLLTFLPRQTGFCPKLEEAS